MAIKMPPNKIQNLQQIEAVVAGVLKKRIDCSSSTDSLIQ
jgi:hypothetical protein